MEIQEQTIRNLLQQVSIVNKKYDDIAKITGERFNIFYIMQMERDEVYTHSSIVAALLNPVGAHGVGSIFLSLFLESLGLNKYLEFDINKAKVFKEVYKGNNDNINLKGGRIDIIIKFNEKEHIVIENKIDHHDEQYQLIRYKNEYPKSQLIYLTLDGKKASPHSTHNADNIEIIKEEDYLRISYRESILKWLELCHPHTFNKPILRETITQYLHLIRKLTNQTTNIDMEQEIIKILLSSKENFSSGQLIKEFHDKANQYVHQLFWDEIEKQGGLSEEIIWKEFKITYEIEEDNDGIYFGFSVKKNNNEGINNTHDELIPLVKLAYQINNKFDNNHLFIGWTYPNTIKDFYDLNHEVIYDLSTQVFRENFVSELLSEGRLYLREFKEKLKEIE